MASRISIARKIAERGGCSIFNYGYSSALRDYTFLYDRIWNAKCNASSRRNDNVARSPGLQVSSKAARPVVLDRHKLELQDRSHQRGELYGVIWGQESDKIGRPSRPRTADCSASWWKSLIPEDSKVERLSLEGQTQFFRCTPTCYLRRASCLRVIHTC
jgi:hypothetical protein